MRKSILVMDDEVSTAITAPGGTVLRDEAHGAETEEGSVETKDISNRNREMELTVGCLPLLLQWQSVMGKTQRSSNADKISAGWRKFQCIASAVCRRRSMVMFNL